ncbi:hypothetical protein JK386_15585 [Nocardioides sp. zg-536]|uniref:DNA polymerase Y-family little finger domain-containing protein n=1 Tax=Nocardioides faecalis TaxID=2803858 RepID=A0A939BZH6_9ACTN|nr:hypothetical protein [Nocardioides faecalis]MBM9461323.1 hypothetical protein [Nocardioides faecalis]QVI57596.1 hypothetical protein KG111_10895 [Nocardioides faecalis]
MAKLASRLAKPDGVRAIPPDRVPAEVHPLDVGALYGVGEATRRRLHLHDLAWGTDRDRLRPGGAGVFGLGEGEAERSMGAQHTLAADVSDRDALHRELLALVARVTRRARTAGRLRRTVAVTVRLADFTTTTRSRSLAEPTAGWLDIDRAGDRAAARFGSRALTRASLLRPGAGEPDRPPGWPTG